MIDKSNNIAVAVGAFAGMSSSRDDARLEHAELQVNCYEVRRDLTLRPGLSILIFDSEES